MPGRKTRSATSASGAAVSRVSDSIVARETDGNPAAKAQRRPCQTLLQAPSTKGRHSLSVAQSLPSSPNAVSSDEAEAEGTGSWALASKGSLFTATASSSKSSPTSAVEKGSSGIGCSRTGEPAKIPEKGETQNVEVHPDCPSALLCHSINNRSGIESPNLNDVVCGQGLTSYHHVGNRRFRLICDAEISAYLEACIHGPQDGVAVAKKIIKRLEGAVPPGRFLVRRPNNGEWAVLKRGMALKRVVQTLREVANARVQAERAIEAEEVLRRATIGGHNGAAGECPHSPLLLPKSLSDSGTWGGSNNCPVSQPSSPDHIPRKSLVIDIVPNKNDILCGRGLLYFDHVGNRRFRILVELNMGRYMKAESNTEEKEAVVCEIMNTIRSCNPPGRFLRKVHPAQAGEQECEQEVRGGRWMELTVQAARKKIGQTFWEGGQLLHKCAGELQQAMMNSQEDAKRPRMNTHLSHNEEKDSEKDQIAQSMRAVRLALNDANRLPQSVSDEEDESDWLRRKIIASRALNGEVGGGNCGGDSEGPILRVPVQHAVPPEAAMTLADMNTTIQKSRMVQNCQVQQQEQSPYKDVLNVQQGIFVDMLDGVAAAEANEEDDEEDTEASSAVEAILKLQESKNDTTKITGKEFLSLSDKAKAAELMKAAYQGNPAVALAAVGEAKAKAAAVRAKRDRTASGQLNRERQHVSSEVPERATTEEEARDQSRPRPGPIQRTTAEAEEEAAARVLLKNRAADPRCAKEPVAPRSTLGKDAAGCRPEETTSFVIASSMSPALQTPIPPTLSNLGQPSPDLLRLQAQAKKLLLRNGPVDEGSTAASMGPAASALGLQPKRSHGEEGRSQGGSTSARAPEGEEEEEARLSRLQAKAKELLRQRQMEILPPYGMHPIATGPVTGGAIFTPLNGGRMTAPSNPVRQQRRVSNAIFNHKSLEMMRPSVGGRQAGSPQLGPQPVQLMDLRGLPAQPTAMCHHNPRRVSVTTGAFQNQMGFGGQPSSRHLENAASAARRVSFLRPPGQLQHDVTPENVLSSAGTAAHYPENVTSDQLPQQSSPPMHGSGTPAAIPTKTRRVSHYSPPSSPSSGSPPPSVFQPRQRLTKRKATPLQEDTKLTKKRDLQTAGSMLTVDGQFDDLDDNGHRHHHERHGSGVVAAVGGMMMMTGKDSSTTPSPPSSVGGDGSGTRTPPEDVAIEAMLAVAGRP